MRKVRNSGNDQKKIHKPEIVSETSNINSCTADPNICSLASDATMKNHLDYKKQKSSNKNEQKKGIERITKENISPQTKTVMKCVAEVKSDHVILKSDQSDDSINSWEDLLEDDGYIQDKLFIGETAEKAATDFTTATASEEYLVHESKPIPENLEHLVELSDFPSSFETHDLMQAYREINSDAMYIKWIDVTHALLVLGSSTQARKGVGIKNPLIKARLMCSASAVALDFVKKSDLRPAMKRPQTSLQTARRLITSHLGAKSRLTKEEIAKEKQDLKDAKEMRRLMKQSENDAWEGNLRSSFP